MGQAINNKYTVVLTRASEELSSTAQPFIERGFNILNFPVIQIVPKVLSAEIRSALEELNNSSFNWIIFTSRNGVKVLSELQLLAGLKIDIPSATNICTVGPETSGQLRSIYKREVSLISQNEQAAGIAESFQSLQANRLKIFIPTPEKSSFDLPLALKALGHTIRAEVIYTTVRTEPDASAIIELSQLDASRCIFTFFSPSAFYALKDTVNQNSLLEKARLASIGPSTSSAIRSAGLEVFAESSDRSAAALAQAISDRLLHD